MKMINNVILTIALLSFNFTKAQSFNGEVIGKCVMDNKGNIKVEKFDSIYVACFTDTTIDLRYLISFIKDDLGYHSYKVVYDTSSLSNILVAVGSDSSITRIIKNAEYFSQSIWIKEKYNNESDTFLMVSFISVKELDYSTCKEILDNYFRCLVIPHHPKSYYQLIRINKRTKEIWYYNHK